MPSLYNRHTYVHHFTIYNYPNPSSSVNRRLNVPPGSSICYWLNRKLKDILTKLSIAAKHLIESIKIRVLSDVKLAKIMNRMPVWATWHYYCAPLACQALALKKWLPAADARCVSRWWWPRGCCCRWRMSGTKVDTGGCRSKVGFQQLIGPDLGPSIELDADRKIHMTKKRQPIQYLELPNRSSRGCRVVIKLD